MSNNDQNVIAVASKWDKRHYKAYRPHAQQLLSVHQYPCNVPAFYPQRVGYALYPVKFTAQLNKITASIVLILQWQQIQGLHEYKLRLDAIPH